MRTAQRAESVELPGSSLVEGAGLVPAGAKHVSEDLAAKTHTFDVTITAPLGLTLGESATRDGSFVWIKSVDEACGAYASGCRAGDRVVATSATLGDAMWPKATISGVVSAVRSRLRLRSAISGAPDVMLRLTRSLDDCEVALAQIRKKETVRESWDVELAKPLGLTLRAGPDGAPVISALKAGGSAARSGDKVRVGDRVVAVESAFGGRMGPAETVEAVMAAAAAPGPRNALRVRLERDVKVGPWRGLLELSEPEALLEDGEDVLDVDALAAGDVRETTRASYGGFTLGEEAEALVRRDVGDALLAYRELRRAELPATATASLLLERCCSLARTYASLASNPARGGGRAVARARLDALLAALDDVPLTAKFATNAVAAYVKVGAPRSAAALFDKCVAEDDARYPVPNRRLVTAGVTAYGKCRRVADGFGVASRMHLWGVKIDVVLGNALLAAAANARDVGRAERLFAALTRVPESDAEEAEVSREAQDSVVLPRRKALADAITYNSMIDVYARAKRPLDAARVLEEMRLAGLKPGRVAHTALMKAHVEAGDLDAAESCLEDLENDYEAVLARTRELAAAGDLHASLAAERARLHARFLPDATSWNTLVRGYARTLRWREASRALQRMRDAGVQPDLLSYTNVATAFLRVDKPREAIEKLDDLEAAYAAACANQGNESRAALRLRPNVVAYTIATLAHAKRGDLVGALLVLREMRRRGVPPNGRTCAALLEACLSAGRPQAGEALAAEMRSAGVREDVVTLTLLLRCHLAGGDADAASRLLDDMETRGRRHDRGGARPSRGDNVPKRSRASTAPNLVTYNAAIAGFAKLGAWDRALDALDRAAARFAPNQATWAALTDLGADRERGADFLHDALTILRDRNRAVGSKAYEAWLLSAARSNDLDRAEALARDRADGHLVILHASARKRGYDDGRRVDAPAKLERLEQALLGVRFPGAYYRPEQPEEGLEERRVPSLKT